MEIEGIEELNQMILAYLQELKILKKKYQNKGNKAVLMRDLTIELLEVLPKKSNLKGLPVSFLLKNQI
jgi:hypothetical protein